MNIIREANNYTTSCDECGKDCKVLYILRGSNAVEEGYNDYAISVCYICLKKLPKTIKETVATNDSQT